MATLRDIDEATRHSVQAVACCISASTLGIALFWLAIRTGADSAAGGVLLITTVGAIAGLALLRGPLPSYDPVATALAYLSTAAGGLLLVELFFAAPAIGPFAPTPWTVTDALATAIFGTGLFAWTGICLGMTYFAARRTYGCSLARRIATTIAGLTVIVAASIYATGLASIVSIPPW